VDDLTERAWWVFALPGGTLAHVPASTEHEAREALAETCYRGAPIEAWPFVASRWMSRAALVKSLLGRPVLRQGEGEPR